MISRHGHTIRKNFYRMFPIEGTRFKHEVLDDLRKFPVFESSETQIPAGYTYLGQFISHEVTRLGRIDSPAGDDAVVTSDLEQLRSPALELDSLYGATAGFGFHTSKDHGKFSSQFVHDIGGTTQIYDIPRDENYSHKSYLIGDIRNDENLLIAQLHVLFLNLHNRLFDLHEADYDSSGECFLATRKECILLFQKIVANDFLEKILDPLVYENLFRKKNFKPYIARVYGEETKLPIEFAIAAFRFGHSLIRPQYNINAKTKIGLAEIFRLTGPGEGWKDVKENLVDWAFQFDLSKYGATNRVDKTARIDMLLDPGLEDMRAEKPGERNLSQRNLRRGQEADLPTGQQIVRYLETEHNGYYTAMKLKEIYPLKASRKPFVNAIEKWGVSEKLPLWSYILLEPHFLGKADRHNRLGKLGSIIIGEVMRDLITTSRISIFRETLDTENSKFLQDMQARFPEKNVSFNSLEMADLVAFTYY